MVWLLGMGKGGGRGRGRWGIFVVTVRLHVLVHSINTRNTAVAKKDRIMERLCNSSLCVICLYFVLCVPRPNRFYAEQHYLR